MEKWKVKRDKWKVKSEKWKVKIDKWNVKTEKWKLTSEMYFDYNFLFTRPIKIIFKNMKTVDQAASIARIIPTFLVIEFCENISFYKSLPSENIF